MSSLATQPMGGQPGAEEPWRQGPTLLASIWRYRFLVLALAVVAGVGGYGISLLQPPIYEATAQLFLSNPRAAAVFSGEQVSFEPSEYAAQQVQLMESASVLTRASELLGGQLVPGDLAEIVSVGAAEEGSLLIEIVATGDSAEEAEGIADAISQAYRDVVGETRRQRAEAAAAQLDPARSNYQERIALLEQQLAGNPGDFVLQSQIQALNGQLLDLESRAQELLVNAAALGSGVDVAEPAAAAQEPVAPSPLRDGLVMAMLGGGLAAAFGYWRAGRARDKVTRTDPASILGVPLLGEIPNYKSSDSDTLAGQLMLQPSTAEAYQFVLASIEFALEQVGGSSLLITSAAPGDGKTTTALQLAMAASRDGRRVVLVDADIRAQGLTRMLGVAERTGLTELARDHLEVDEAVHYLPVSDELLLPVVAAGGRVDDAGSFFRAPGFRKAVQRIKDEAELVMTDSSPLLAVADTAVITGQMDALVLVVDHGTPIAQLEQVRERLAFTSTPLLGYVYNRSPQSALAAYGYEYGRDSRPTDAPKARRQPRNMSTGWSLPSDRTKSTA